MWNAISNMIIKASDNINRGVDNAATEAGEGNNGQNYGNAASNLGGQVKELAQDGAKMIADAKKNKSDSDSETESSTPAMQTPTKKSFGSGTPTGMSVGMGTNNGDTEAKSVGTSIPAIGNIGDSVGKVGAMPSGGISSDERLKRIFKDNPDAIQAFAKIDAIKFTYNDKAKEVHPDGENGVDNDQHYGVKAQDLEENPYTTSVVTEDKSGYKQVDPLELTMANTGVISELCKRLLTIEKILGIKVV